MPMITVKFDDNAVKDQDIALLCEGLKKITIEATGIPEVFVYADSPRIKVNVAPIEVFIEMSASKVENKEQLFEKIKTGLVAWKQENNFSYPVTITLIPMDWKFEVGI
jgi:hypothetical protein